MLRRFFDAENPLMRALSVACDLLLLNLLAALCCLPVVTLGPALAALCHVSLRLVRGEESSVLRTYFRTLRANLKQGIPLGLLFLAAALVLYVDYLIAEALAPLLRAPVLAGALVVIAIALYAFALLPHFDDTIFRTLKNAAALAVGYFPRTLGMVLFTVGMWGVCLRFFVQAAPVLLMFGLSMPAYFCALLYNDIFRRFEPENEKEDDE